MIITQFGFKIKKSRFRYIQQITNFLSSAKLVISFYFIKKKKNTLKEFDFINYLIIEAMQKNAQWWL